MLRMQLSLFIIFTAIVSATANEKNPPIVRFEIQGKEFRSERYEYTFSVGSKVSPETALSKNILLCCLPQLKQNLSHPIQPTTVTCKSSCDLIRPTKALYGRDISDSGHLLPIRTRSQFASSDNDASTFISSSTSKSFFHLYNRSSINFWDLTDNILGGDNEKSRNFALRIPLPPIGSKLTASSGTVEKISLPRKIQQYVRIDNNNKHTTARSRYERPAPIGTGYASTYRHSEGTNIGPVSYRRPSYMEVPCINSADASMTARRKSITSYIRPTGVTENEDKRSYTQHTTQNDYPNPQTQVVASDQVHETSNGQCPLLLNNVTKEIVKSYHQKQLLTRP
uniref:Uncharacterized protein n=1 Tax=Elaeophora elaphi TaxID=1147741 RepID=A0A0R3RVL7_9BILA